MLWQPSGHMHGVAPSRAGRHVQPWRTLIVRRLGRAALVEAPQPSVSTSRKTSAAAAMSTVASFDTLPTYTAHRDHS